MNSEDGYRYAGRTNRIRVKDAHMVVSDKQGLSSLAVTPQPRNPMQAENEFVILSFA
jgi:hypothetical protein